MTMDMDGVGASVKDVRTARRHKKSFRDIKFK